MGRTGLPQGNFTGDNPKPYTSVQLRRSLKSRNKERFFGLCSIQINDILAEHLE